MPADARIVEHARAIAEIAEIEATDEQIEAVAQRLLLLMRRPPAQAGDDLELGETEPAFGLQVRRT
jgi:hypothetical protein